MLSSVRSACRAMLAVCLVTAAPAIAGDCAPVWSQGLGGSGPVYLIPGSSGPTCSII
jgi:hypothetical protein